MKRLLAFFGFFILFVLPSTAQTVSYWFQGWQKKPDAQQAAAYFMEPGANVTFTYANNRVIINAGAGGVPSLQLFGDVTSPLTPLPNVTATLGNVDVSHLNGGVGAGATTFWRGDGTWSVPGAGLYVAKAGDIMTGNLTNTTYLFVGNQTNYVAIDPGSISISKTNQPYISIAEYGINAVTIIYSGANGLSFKLPGGTPRIGTNGVYYGDGLGLTNIQASSISGTLTNLPSWIAYTTSNNVFTTSNVFQGSLVVTGANYLALSNGAARVLMTNGAVIVSGPAQSSFGGNIGANNGVNATYLQAQIGQPVLWGASTRLFGMVDGLFTIASNSFPTSTLQTYWRTNWPTFTVFSPSNSAMGIGFNGVLYMTNNINVSAGSVTATNLVTSAVKWIDAQGQIFGALPVASSKTIVPTVDLGDGTFAYAFSRITVPNPYGKEIVPFTSEAPHTIAVTNATYGLTNLYVEPHFHGRPGSAPVAPNTNIAFQIVYKACTTGVAPSATFTNTVTYGLIAGSTNEMLIEFGHLTYATNMPDIATTWPCTITTEDPGSNQYLSQAGASFIFRQPSFHVPVGNRNAIGSSLDNAP